MKSKLRILLIEDNHDITKQLAEFFDGLNWNLDFADRGELGLILAVENNYDVVILDLSLPDKDGITVCREIKQRSDTNVPILMLTARDAFEDKAEGFGSGADDYVTKPFEFRELALRCQALARRNELHRVNVIEVGSLSVDKAVRKAVREGQSLKLTKMCFDILFVLAEAYPNAVTRSHLIHRVWADDVPDSDALRAHIYSLRNELDKPFDSAMLVTMINVGYKLVLGDEV